MAELRFLGGTGTVTGSKYLLRSGTASVLVDCGLFQGLKALRLRNWAPPPVAATEIDAVVLTHAHLDHSGYLPRLMRQGFAGPVHASPGTRDLCAILLPDSGHLQEEEARYANKRGFSKHKPALPLYTEDDARASLKRFAPVPFGKETEVAGEFHLTLQPAGHILGAAIATLRAGGVKIVFSGDLGRMNDPIMRPPSALEEADYLVVESTYGNRRHEQADPEETLGSHLNRALARGGVVIMPAFAVGRAQTLLYFLSRLRARGAIPEVPVYLNSPMAINATRLYHEYMAEHRLSDEQCEAAHSVAELVHTADESRALNGRGGPMIIVSASGMATGGRVVHHLKAFAPDARNMIVLPGFQAAGTRGAALAAGAAEIKIHGDYVPVRAEVVKMDSMSAHADYTEILEWLRGFKRPPKRTFVTHGEPSAADEMRRRIEETLGWSVSVPEYGDKADLR
ncbi:MAG TPA: MBL fold metallo-hydrolase [Burkholderiales bacterium]|nr:MBL fold metallo-hydrolase [Burkholderiales bacterium]